MIYDYSEPSTRTYSQEQYEDLLDDFEEVSKEKEEVEEDINDLITEILDLGNKYGFDEAYIKLFEYVKGNKLDEKYN